MVVRCLVMDLIGAQNCGPRSGPVDETSAGGGSLEAVVEGQGEDVPDEVERLKHAQKEVGQQVTHDLIC